MKKLKLWIKRHPVKTKRILEILPGLTSWFLILFPVWGSFVIPEVVAYYIIAFTIYWFYRSMSVALLSIYGYLKLQANQTYDWMGDVKLFPDWQKVQHIVVIPTYQEPLATLERTLRHLKKQTFPHQNLHIMISFEEREGETAKTKAEKLKRKFGQSFGHLWTTFHPDLPGEVKGKSSNTAWGAKKAKELLVDGEGVEIEYVTITSEDADALLHEKYFAALSFQFLDDPHRYHKLWQGVLFFYNNIWKVPFPVRVFNSMSSITHIYINTRKDRLINFSTYSASLKMIDQIGYWDTDVIPEDWRLFFKAFYKLGGDLTVEPLFLPIMADAAESTSTWKNFVVQYEQIKRWAWGVSDTPYVITNWILDEKAPFWEKTIRMLRLIEDHFLWPVNWFAITIGALLPPWLNPKFARTMLGKTLPQLTSFILTLCLLALVVMIGLNLKLRPKRERRIPILSTLGELAEFVVLPIVGFTFSALPGIDAHTRLLLGKYIEYRVTEKVKPS